MSTQRDFYFEVSAGNVPGHRAIHKFGHNPDANSAGVFWPIMEAAAAGAKTVYEGFNAVVAQTVSIVSVGAGGVNDTAAGTGAQVVEVFGLDSRWAPQSERIELNGATPVLTTKLYIRMDVAIVRRGGALGANQGAITGTQSGSGFQFFVIGIGDNRTMQATFTIPVGERGFLIYQDATTNRQQASGSVEARLRVRPPGEVFQVLEPFDATVGGGMTSREYRLPKDSIEPKTDIFLESSSVSAGIGVTGGFDLILIKTAGV